MVAETCHEYFSALKRFFLYINERIVLDSLINEPFINFLATLDCCFCCRNFLVSFGCIMENVCLINLLIQNQEHELYVLFVLRG